MKWDSLKTKLYEKLKNSHYGQKNDGYLSTTELEDYGRALGYSASNAGRRVRDLFQDGLLEKRPRYVEAKKVWIEEYRWKDETLPTQQVFPKGHPETQTQGVAGFL